MKVFRLVAAISKARRFAMMPAPGIVRHGNAYYPSPSIPSILRTYQENLWDVERLSPLAFRLCRKLGWF
jgi:hypothetical protein